MRTFWTITVDDNGFVSRIFGNALLPHPSSARGTGERPGFDAEAHRQREAKRLQALANEFARAGAPIIFRGFARNVEEATSELEPLLKRLIDAFPESTYSISVHDWWNPTDEQGKAFAAEMDHYDITYPNYPTIAVERAGKVFRGASESLSFDEIVLFVTFLLGRHDPAS